MKLTLQLRLLPDIKQKAILLETMERFNAAATFAAKIGYDAAVFSQPSIHKLCYKEIRDRFKLSAQMAVRAISKAVEAFAVLKSKSRKKCPTFKARGAITYDQRILSFKGVDRASLWTLAGRMILPLIYGQYQRERFNRLKGQVDLVYRKSSFFLYATIDLPENSPVEIKDFLGIDFGIVNLAVDSDGNTYTGESVEKIRRRHHHNRRRLQKCGTKGAKKRLRALAGREAQFRRHKNHQISKALVTLAKDTGRGITIENLTGIRSRKTVRRKDRARHEGWAFYQLRAFIEYKAALAGIPVVAVNPRNTSRTCSACGHCEKGNRPNRDTFRCLHCSYSTNADFNAAQNLRVLGLGACKRPSELAGISV